MTRQQLQIRPFTDDELPTAFALLGEVFHEKFDDADLDAERTVQEPARSFAAFDGDQMVGCLGCYSHTFSVPGGDVACGGTTWVGVKPTHRRQGILRRMMDAHLREVREQGDPIAALWASETAIYGRFGYGLAAESQITTLHAGGGLAWRTDIPAPETSFRAVEVDAAAPQLQPIYDAVRRERAGMHVRDQTWWAFQVLSTRSSMVEGSAKRVVVASRDGEDVGYVIYSTKESWEPTGPAGTVAVTELLGVDGAAEVGLWRFLAGIDLTTTVRSFRRPVDDLLAWALDDPRRVERRVSDALHVRIVDVAAALQARSYAVSAGVTVELTDPLFDDNDGTWRLEVAPEGAHVEPSTDPPDLAMHVRELGSLYLGAANARRLARLGLIDVRNPDALVALDAAMRSPLAPWGVEVW